MSVNIPVIKLCNWQEMPMIGLGTYARKADPGQYRQAVEMGIDIGYRHIDTASFYGNEGEVGEGIRHKIQQGVVRREDLFVTTKLWNDCHAEEAVVPSLWKSLATLGLDYVDLYLMHWPVSVNEKGEDAKKDYLETWKGMQSALKLRLTRSIGVSNFNAVQLKRLVKHAEVRPVVNQIEINPTLTQHPLVYACKLLSVQPVAYTPLGLLSEARPEYAHIAAIKSDERLGALAERLGKSRAQLALKYLLQRDIVVVPKSFTASHMRENAALFDFELSADEAALLDGFNVEHRCVPGRGFEGLANYPY